jgi:putative N-acetyltransferase (TIGR04045 family)
MIESPALASIDPFACRLARSPGERAAYFALRRSIFCLEQGLFAGDDRDEWDEVANPIVCLHGADAHADVVGVVRIWESSAGDWWGGRLGVDAQFRTAATVGRRLVQTAVGTARAWGARRFRATVQRANVPFFRRLRWRTLEEVELHQQPHHLMEADLAWYLPTAEARPGREAEDAHDRASDHRKARKSRKAREASDAA